VSVLVDFTNAVIRSWWRCDACSAETVPRTVDEPRIPALGWAWLDYGGSVLHVCPPCRISFGIDPGCNPQHPSGGDAARTWDGDQA
jgi:hypothetical protein